MKLVFQPHFWRNSWRKIYLTLYSANWPSLISSFPLFLEISGCAWYMRYMFVVYEIYVCCIRDIYFLYMRYMFVVIVSYSGCDAINFGNSVGRLCVSTNFPHQEIRSNFRQWFIRFKGHLLKEITSTFLEGERWTLSGLSKIYLMGITYLIWFFINWPYKSFSEQLSSFQVVDIYHVTLVIEKSEPTKSLILDKMIESYYWELSEAVTQRCCLWKSSSKKFPKIQRKTPVPESLFK